MLSQKRNETVHPAVGPSSSTGAASAAPSLLGDESLAEMMSEAMSMTSWNDTESHYDMSEIRSIPSSKGTARFSTASEAQRLRTKYDSACERIRVLTEEVTELESENAQLQEAHRQDMARLALQQEIGHLQQKADILAEASVRLPKEIEDLRQQRANLQRELDGHENISRQTSLSIESLRGELSRTNEEYEYLKAVNGTLQKGLEDQSTKVAAAIEVTNQLRQHIQSTSEEAEGHRSSNLSIQNQEDALRVLGDCYVIRIKPKISAISPERTLRLKAAHFEELSISLYFGLTSSAIVVRNFVSRVIRKTNDRSTPDGHRGVMNLNFNLPRGRLQGDISSYDTTYLSDGTSSEMIMPKNMTLTMSLSSTFAEFVAAVCRVLGDEEHRLCRRPELIVLVGGEFERMTQEIFTDPKPFAGNIFVPRPSVKTLCLIELSAKKKLGWTE